MLPGQPALQAVLREQVLDVLHRPAEYARLGVSRPAGVLLAGPPGCGKSFAAARLAGFLGWPLHEISVASGRQRLVARDAAQLAEAFASRRRGSPAIVLLEELDALGKSRAGGSVPAVEEVNTLLRRVETRRNAGCWSSAPRTGWRRSTRRCAAAGGSTSCSPWTIPSARPVPRRAGKPAGDRPHAQGST